jgi:hypothetical protein
MRTNILRMTVAVLMAAAITFGFTSCNGDERLPEVDYFDRLIVGKRWENTWYEGGRSIVFNSDNTYSYVDGSEYGETESFNGIYKIVSQIDTTYSVTETLTYLWYNGIEYPDGIVVTVTEIYEPILIKMMASSGRADFDYLWVYYHPRKNYGGGTYRPTYIEVHLYSGKEFVRILASFSLLRYR